MQAIVESLPIDEYENLILEHVESSPVSIIQGETGSGKSSRVPVMLRDHWNRRRRGSDKGPVRPPLVIVTQPRRIAAVSLAKRVAEQVGDPQAVGYSIGGDRQLSSRTQIRYVTTGWCVEKLIHCPEFLSEVTHLVLDEVHERSIDADILHMLVKEVMLKLPSAPKLVLMSATMDSSVFAEYYTPEAATLPPSIFVGQHRFPIKECFVEDFSSLPELSRIRVGNVDKLRSLGYGGFTDELFLQVVSAVHNYTGGGICILVFLPGLAEIDRLYAALVETEEKEEPKKREDAQDAQEGYVDMEATATEAVEEALPQFTRYDVLVLHSVIERDDQMRCFADVPAHKTRIILATNIAESSVTIPNAVYVIDSGLHKHMAFDPRFKCVSLQTVNISKAAAIQRAGRCGRVSPGTVLRFYTKREFDSMEDYEQPDIQRLPLEEVILRLKISAAGSGNLIARPMKALAQTIDPPSPKDVIGAYERLKSHHMLFGDCDDPDDLKVTPLGTFQSKLSFDMRLGRLLVTALSLFQPKANPRARRDSKTVSDDFLKLIGNAERGRLQADLQRYSDPLGHLSVFLQFCKETRKMKIAAKKRWCVRKTLHVSRFLSLHRSVRELSRRLLSILPARYKACLTDLINDSLQSELSPEDVTMMRFIISFSLSDSLIFSTTKANKFRPRDLGFALKKKNKKKNKKGGKGDVMEPPPYKDPLCCVFLSKVPSDLLTEKDFQQFLGPFLGPKQDVPTIHIGKLMKGNREGYVAVEFDDVKSAAVLQHQLSGAFFRNKLQVFAPNNELVTLKEPPVRFSSFSHITHVSTEKPAKINSNSVVPSFVHTGGSESQAWMCAGLSTLVNSSMFFLDRVTLLDPNLKETAVILALHPMTSINRDKFASINDMVVDAILFSTTPEDMRYWVSLKHKLIAAVGVQFALEGHPDLVSILENELLGKQRKNLISECDDGWLLSSLAKLLMYGEGIESEEQVLASLRFKAKEPVLITRQRLRDVVNAIPLIEFLNDSYMWLECDSESDSLDEEEPDVYLSREFWKWKHLHYEEDNIKVCSYPGCASPKRASKRCGRCKARYCGVGCQKLHYRVHKLECRKKQ